MRVARGGGEVGLAQGGALTIGNFDGLHLGQQALVREVVAQARATAGPATVVSFEPHPLVVLAPERAPARLTSDRQREALLAGLGVDQLWIVPFDRALASLPAERFVSEWLVAAAAPRRVLVGKRFAFGHRRQGDLTLLGECGRRFGFEAIGIDERQHDDAAISSTRIRELLERGAVEEAEALLGRPYAIDGTVVEGDRLGRQLGFPTANVRPVESRQLVPAHGVYAAELHLGEPPVRHAGVANLGVRPTRGKSGEVQLEVHLLEFDRQIYGERVEVALCRRLRDERRFDGLEALRRQIAIDTESAREYFSRPERLGERRKTASGSDLDPRSN